MLCKISVLGSRLPSGNSDEDPTIQDEETDTEQHDSLPEDKVSVKETRSANAAKKLLQLKGNSEKKSDSKRNIHRLHQSSSKSTSSGEKRRDSVSLTGIPVITISKTESSESILNEQEGKCSNSDVSSENTTVKSVGSHKPKIKYLLRKQDAKIDIDSVSFI